MDINIASSAATTPISERALELRRKMSPERWTKEVEKAHERLWVVLEVEQLYAAGHGGRAACLREAVPGRHWSTYRYWRTCLAERNGPEWERLLDARVPPSPESPSIEVRVVVEAVKRAMPRISYEEVRRVLLEQFGESGRLSDSTLYRIWRRVDLVRPELGDPGRFEKVESFSGGAGAALVGAAETEFGIMKAIAQAALEAGDVLAQAQQGGEPRDPHSGRDERGRFTASYNHAVREGVKPGQADSRWDSDNTKRQRRDLSTLAVLGLAPETLAQRLLVMGMAPMMGNLRGFDGLEGPRGLWLQLAGPQAYRPATIDKTLSELGQLGVDEAMWAEYGRRWAPKATEWAEGAEHWRTLVRYLDISGEPYYTKRFALSGKVARVGKVMPCLDRVTLTGGPGVPLRMRTFPGSQSLRKHLRELLAEEGAALRDNDSEENFWITVVDAEAAQAGLLAELCELPSHCFITVVKGNIRKGVKFLEEGPWECYRQRDRIREVTVSVFGQGAPKEGLTLRGVEMERENSRHPHRTLFVTDAAESFLTTSEVVDAYLSRWPNQEQVFRRARHGAGMEHSHGYTGDYVTHVALEKKVADAKLRVERSQAAVEKAKVRRDEAAELKLAHKGTPQGKLTRQVAKEADRKMTQAESRHQAALETVESLATTSDTIFERDTTRENIVTATTMSVMMLVEWVLREFFGGIRMELPTFLHYFFHLPVEVRTTWQRVLYRIDVRGLSQAKVDMLRIACEEITRRKIRRDERWLKFEIAESWAKSRDGP